MLFIFVIEQTALALQPAARFVQTVRRQSLSTQRTRWHRLILPLESHQAGRDEDVGDIAKDGVESSANDMAPVLLTLRVPHLFEKRN